MEKKMEKAKKSLMDKIYYLKVNIKMAKDGMEKNIIRMEFLYMN